MPLPKLRAHKAECQPPLVTKQSLNGLQGVVKQILPRRLKVPRDVQGCHGTINKVPPIQGPACFASSVEKRIHDHDIRIDHVDDAFATVDDSDIFY